MNNTTTISTLAAIVVVVVLIFTSGSLAAAVTSSSTPQPQNLICAHTSNNATCTKEGIISTATQIPLPMPQQLQPPAALAITRHVIEDIVATISTKDFSIGASGTNVSPQSSFLGPNTAVTSKPGTFPVALLQQANATTITANATTITANATTITAVAALPFKMPIVNPMAVLQVKGIPSFAIVDVIGKMAVAAAVELLPKIA
jgi:hypothetical protein